MFKKILIANRGEIACRILKTCQRLKIRTVAVFSYADRNALHVKLADESYLLPKKDNVQAYLAVNDIIQIAKDSKAEAIHPGYGFLSENLNFPKACQKAGITFIGPDAKPMALLGNKRRARERALKLSIPVAPAFTFTGSKKDSKSELNQFVKATGLPLLVKAEAGGGGKGMRIVREAKDLATVVKNASREAELLFANGAIYIEKYIEKARHIEVQFIADSNGTVHILFCRDCSVQRNHQKIIEEAPAYDLPSELEQQAYEYTRKLVSGTDYHGAGTVEFLLSDDRELFFLEVNTRLQVEHPVSEYICDLDLVELQIKVASNKPIKNQIPSRPLSDGYAFELRVCAESSDGTFTPSSGKIIECSFPDSGSIRVDTGYVTGDYFPSCFDSLLAKIIVYGKNREFARKQALLALQSTSIVGLETNCTLLTEVLKNIPQPCTSSLTNYLLKRNYTETLAEAACYVCAHLIVSHNYQTSTLTGFRIVDEYKFEKLLDVKGDVFKVSGDIKSATSFKLKCNETVVDFSEIRAKDEFEFTGLCNSELQTSELWITGDTYWLKNSKGMFPFTKIVASPTLSSKSSRSNLLHARLPGVIRSVLVKENATVEAGQVLANIESMKMEHAISASAPATVKKIHIQKDQQVQSNDLLFELTYKC